LPLGVDCAQMSFKGGVVGNDIGIQISALLKPLLIFDDPFDLFLGILNFHAVVSYIAIKTSVFAIV
jgi:hypothetical protein